MILNILDRYLPSPHGMTLFTICAKLATMNIRVAVGTALAHIPEHQAGVALRAGHLGMHAAERISRLVVIEFRIGTDRLPAYIRVTVLAGDGDGTVRIRDLRLGRRGTLLRSSGGDPHLHAKQRNSQRNGDHDYPAKPIQTISPQSLRLSRGQANPCRNATAR